MLLKSLFYLSSLIGLNCVGVLASEEFNKSTTEYHDHVVEFDKSDKEIGSNIHGR